MQIGKVAIASMALWGSILSIACSASDDSGGRAKGGAAGRTTSGGAGGSGATGGAGPGSGGSGGTFGTGGNATGGTTIDPGGGGRLDAGGQDVQGDTSDGGRMIDPGCAATQTKADDVTKVVPADIIFAIDSSGSMDAEIGFVQAQMNAFSQQITASGIDVRVILIGDPSAICIGAPLGSGTCPNDTKLPNYIHIPTEVGSNDALNVIIQTYPQWRQYLRADASKSLVVVTDDDATDRPNNSAATFRANFTALDPTMLAKWTMNGVYCFTDCPEAADIGHVYVDLVAQTMGVGGDLCLQNFKPVFDALATKIITTSGTKLTCDWALPPAPMGKTFAGDLVQVRRSNDGGANAINKVATSADCAQGGWYFDNNFNPTRILACPSTCMQLQSQPGGQIDITYGCESVGSCVAKDSSAVNAGACEWNMPMPPIGQMLDFTNVNIRYTSGNGFATQLGKVPSAADCAMFARGWYYDNPATPTKIFACPQTCTEMQAGGANAKVDVLFGCKTTPATPK
ncbi:MAG: vWA domain-containing protein [Polyangiaceae bacterium]